MICRGDSPPLEAFSLPCKNVQLTPDKEKLGVCIAALQIDSNILFHVTF